MPELATSPSADILALPQEDLMQLPLQLLLMLVTVLMAPSFYPLDRLQACTKYLVAPYARAAYMCRSTCRSTEPLAS